MGRGANEQTPSGAALRITGTHGPFTDAQINQLLPVEHEGYLRALAAKHFSSLTATGSWFTDVGSVNELLSEAVRQRGTLDGDDRDLLLSLGAQPGAFMPASSGVRYVMVRAGGVNGLVPIETLADEEPVLVVRTKPGTPCSLVVHRSGARSESFGTIIVGPNQHETPSTSEMIWTAHPGPPVSPATEDLWNAGLRSQSPTSKHVLAILASGCKQATQPSSR